MSSLTMRFGLRKDMRIMKNGEWCMNKLNFLVAVAVLAIVGITNASTITWNSEAAPVEGDWGKNLSADLFDLIGTLELAENSGSGSSTVFDGIPFAEPTIDFGLNTDVYHSDTPLSDTGTYFDARRAATLTNLVVGREYRIQALVYDGRGHPAIIGRYVKFDDVNLGVYANGSNDTWGDGLLVTGTFCAAAETISFVIQTFNSGGDKAGSQLNAITLYLLPPRGAVFLIL